MTGDSSTIMTEQKAIAYINDTKNHETLVRQINAPHFDVIINRERDKANLIQFLCTFNCLPNLIEALLKKKVQVSKANNMKQPLVEKDSVTMMHGCSSLQLAVFGLHHKLVEKLLLSKVNANRPDARSMTALRHIIDMYQVEAFSENPNSKQLG